jgi:hypothetical protein
MTLDEIPWRLNNQGGRENRYWHSFQCSEFYIETPATEQNSYPVGTYFIQELRGFKTTFDAYTHGCSNWEGLDAMTAQCVLNHLLNNKITSEGNTP